MAFWPLRCDTSAGREGEPAPRRQMIRPVPGARRPSQTSLYPFFFDEWGDESFARGAANLIYLLCGKRAGAGERASERESVRLATSPPGGLVFARPRERVKQSMALSGVARSHLPFGGEMDEKAPMTGPAYGTLQHATARNPPYVAHKS